MLLARVVVAAAQTNVSAPTSIADWAERLSRFGSGVPQEKVFVHMDNTCYFMGDTIWYAAYLRRTDTGRPSDVSRVLYVELLNEEGYLVERQIVNMRGGRGHGNFVLADTLYGGYYELRAYTRWQLNWGRTEKEHTSYAEDWFFSKRLAHEFYRDYEKLYSRVFPVYDHPLQAGDYYREMTSRPLRRYYSDGAKEPALKLMLYPEGGHAVAGVQCTLAFEAATEDGEAIAGRLDATAAGLSQPVATRSRGRGTFTFIPRAGQEYTFTFTADDGRIARATLPAVETDGVAMHVNLQFTIHNPQLTIAAAGAATRLPLGLSIMHEGRVLAFTELLGECEMGNGGLKVDSVQLSSLIAADSLPIGVLQATVFDAQGRVWADRLFWSAPRGLKDVGGAIDIRGLKEEYAPFETTTIDVRCTKPDVAGLSLAVRDAATSDATYDTSDILSEMLLASEVRGYIPDPAYFFEADDAEHRDALDLLMLTQGWRRYDWRAMAVPGAFTLSQPAETITPIIRGEILNYEASAEQDEVRSYSDVATPYQMESSLSRSTDARKYRDSLRTSGDISAEDSYTGLGQGEVIESVIAQTYAHENHFPAGSYRMLSDIARSRFAERDKPLENEVRVHAEFTQPGSQSIVGDMDTRNGVFSIPSPDFEGYCIFFLAASDTTKWKPSKRHNWVVMETEKTDLAEYYVRVSWPYPRFTQPYNYYQSRTVPNPIPERSSPTRSLSNEGGEVSGWSGGLAGGGSATQMQTVTVRARHEGLRRFQNLKPAFCADAYEAFNAATDAGLMSGQMRGRFHFINSIARLYVGDMNSSNAYLLEPRYNGRNISFNFTPAQMNRFNQLTNLDSVRIYTDFQPRNGADPRATEDNIDRVTIDVWDMPNEGQRVTYRDRRFVLQGFATPDTFYNPVYHLPSGATPPADYRRTLYWNPDMQLDDQGHATVTFSTGSRPVILNVSANGIAADGTPLTN